jgi:hypothetical protein
MKSSLHHLILNHLHLPSPELDPILLLAAWDPRYIALGRTPRKTPSSIIKDACLLVRYLATDVILLRAHVAGTCLQTRCLAMGIQVTIHIELCSRYYISNLLFLRQGSLYFFWFTPATDPSWRTSNSYSIPNAITTLLWRKMPLPMFTYSILPVSPTCCTPDGGRWLYSPPIGRLWISLTPSSDIKIINNPITLNVLKQKQI